MDNSAVQLNESAHGMRIREAYLRTKDRIAAVKVENLTTINVDIQAIVTSTRGRLGKIMAFRDRLPKELPTLATESFDLLEDYTLATAYTHGQYRGTSTPVENLPELQVEAAGYVDMLFSDASALSKRGIIDGSKLSELKGPNGYRGTAFVLLTVYTLLRENWDAINGKTALTLEELERAGVVADELMVAAGVRESGPQVLASAILNRQRAFSLFVEAYDQVRRAITFLRWNEGDIDEIAPSLYAGRKRKSGTDLAPEEQITDPEATVGTTPAISSVVAAPVTNNTVTKQAVGLPGSNPFQT